MKQIKKQKFLLSKNIALLPDRLKRHGWWLEEYHFPDHGNENSQSRGKYKCSLNNSYDAPS